MSFYYRKAGGKPWVVRRGAMRLLTATALLAYPAGCLTLLLAPDTTPEPSLTGGEIAGFGLFLLAIASFAVIAPSSFQRIVAEEAKHLDEFEMDLRRRANAMAYQIFTALTLLGLIYLGIASDSEARIAFWTPSTFDHWNAIIWGAILYAFVLPTAVLAWVAPAPVREED
ncbi:MAG: hypothetical protein RKE49_05975 [Oceanicaulis sp.]